ncbi:hypothetical protein AOL_s00054g133 [Orbilia oligospora ATCC 24927]|uniref:Epoxide hydrolase N-terminal domain-containing protein n=1 Tax=Arthrobotrys oligospora (strain ATCC 24927 / CBS 115.81 / DSM 1491) TaxID=756982 RepID=G1X5I9_ARTOA|nr:hypothetical protein AOL_s00054g133 [Orbilia oligospora ATCC 24927]EGX51434.1 hypothetical protein AOL_s00054g133 [Orbilia oligospora ATCC 24927]
MDDTRPYKISVPQERIDLIKQKLDLANFPDELENSDWDLGTPLSEIKRLTKYWKEGFNWREVESRLNEVPQFTTPIEVDGFEPLATHFVHVKCDVPGVKAIPLLFIHGWPGSFLESLKLIPLLTSGADGPYFDVVAPSLADFGFSDAVKRIGFDPSKHADLYHKLMLKLGYNEYVTQGGDWGAIISKFIAVKYGPTHCRSSHFNFMWWVSAPKVTKNPFLWLQYNLQPHSELDKERLTRRKWFYDEGFGYNDLQRSKPQTIGYALQDSPVGLLAWIYEKMHDWSDGYKWTDDEILTWVSMYAYSNAGPAASGRIYYMDQHQPADQRAIVFSPIDSAVPIGISVFPLDIVVWPLAWGRTAGRVVFEKVHPSGGHFAAHERPEWLAEDLKTMFGKKGNAYGVVTGRNGYIVGAKL